MCLTHPPYHPSHPLCFLRLTSSAALHVLTHRRRKVKPPQEAQILDYDALEKVPDDPELTHVLLDKLVICKLNGGLGTTMGCQGPKSCLEVHPDRTFLDLTVRQVEVRLHFVRLFQLHSRASLFLKE